MSQLQPPPPRVLFPKMEQEGRESPRPIAGIEKGLTARLEMSKGAPRPEQENAVCIMHRDSEAVPPERFGN